MGTITYKAVVAGFAAVMLTIMASLIYGTYIGVPSNETNIYKECNECHNYHSNESWKE